MPQDLNSRFAIPGLRFEYGKGGLIRAVVDTPTARGELFLQGAHVTQWTPVGQQPVLWMSGASHFEKGKPIRGGVPICFPWFGPSIHDPSAPAHGFARLAEWQITSARAKIDGAIELNLQTTIEPFSLNYQVAFGRELKLTLTTHLNTNATSPLTYEDALHTYLSVSDVRSISISGLESTSYLDKVDGATMKPAAAKAIEFTSETDRVYMDTIVDCVLTDSNMKRTIRVAKSGSSSTVVWNPWIDKSKRMADFGDDEWPSMVCIETANVASNRIEIAPGESHATSSILSVAEMKACGTL